ncbi:MAG: PQQ-binding-like beta-propeller repeat protein [Planctomycetota bacterium]
MSILVAAVALCATVLQEARPAPPAAAPAPAHRGWPIFRGDAGLSGVAATTLDAEIELHWTYAAGGPITSSPVLVDGLVYFGSDDQKLHAVEAATGAGRWTFKTEDFIEAPPFVAAGTVYVGSNDTYFYAVDAATGALRWKQATGDKIIGSANSVQLASGLAIVVGSYDASLYCFDARTGERRWAYTTDNYVNGAPAIDAGRAIFGGCDAILHVVDVTKGERASAVELGGDCHIAGSIAFLDGRAYFGHYGNAFVCVDVAKGEVVWSYASQDQAFFSSPALTADRVVFGGRDRNLHCVKRDTGEGLWKFKTRRKVDGSPVIAGDKVVFGSGDGRLYVLALADGAEVWSQDLGQPILSSPAVVDGKVYIGANDGLLYCFGPVRAKPSQAGGEKGDKE